MHQYFSLQTQKRKDFQLQKDELLTNL